MKALLCVLAGIACFSVYANTPDDSFETFSGDCDHTKTSFKCVHFVRNYDGDTFTVNIDNVPVILGSDVGVRVLGVDSPEINGEGPCESRLAEKAKVETQEILENARRIDLKNVQRDKYFRILADVVADGDSLAERLIRRKLAVPYDGNTKPNVNWCRL